MLGGRLTALACAGLAATGIAACGGSEPEEAGGIRTGQPEVTFAPVVQLAERERYRPMDARWFLARSALWLADDQGCPDGKIAVGRQLRAQRTPVVDWLYLSGIGWGPTYWRQMYKPGCEDKRQRYRYFANQRTRPHDDAPDRAKGMRVTEGYYLDLMDWAREGPPRADGGSPDAAQVLYKRRHPAPDARPGLRLTYSMLYGMSEPRDASGRPIVALTHEGDWERVDVLLSGEKGRYEPVGVRLIHEQQPPRWIPWSTLHRALDERTGRRTHPVLYAARDSHTLHARPGRHRHEVRLGRETVTIVDLAAASCKYCGRWRTWEDLADVRTQPWYGFGGAWGKPGRTEATTGPLGPHGTWGNGTATDNNLERPKQRPHDCEQPIWRRNCAVASRDE